MPEPSKLNRRELLVGGALLTVSPAAASPETPGTSPKSIYESIGVRPIINCRGTFTIIGGSLELPEVTAAQQTAAQHFVQLDELADAIGQRLCELTGADWGMVSSGCAAALAHATAACVAGGNPDLHTRIPDLTGFAKDKVIIPAHSRNEYDAAIRSVGVRIIEVSTMSEYRAALDPRVAMVYVLAGPNAESGTLPYDTIYSLARDHNIPVLVDAAAEMLTIPNVHLKRGATLVGYSGGKCMRGPQSAGLLLGRKDLVEAAWIHSAPHHGYGRAMKVGKEEAMGMLAAVEAWTRRNHEAEWNNWMENMRYISKAVERIDGVSTYIEETTELSNHSPVLNIRWDTDKIGVLGSSIEETLFTTEPRITLVGHSASENTTGVSITAYMMSPGDEKIVAERLQAELSKAAGQKWVEETTAAPSAAVAGSWRVEIQFAAARSVHKFYLTQSGADILGTHQGDFLARDLAGTIHRNSVTITSRIGEQHGAALTYRFIGTCKGDSMSGEVNLGEYRTAKWTATRTVSTAES